MSRRLSSIAAGKIAARSAFMRTVGFLGQLSGLAPSLTGFMMAVLTGGEQAVQRVLRSLVQPHSLSLYLCMLIPIISDAAMWLFWHFDQMAAEEREGGFQFGPKTRFQQVLVEGTLFSESLKALQQELFPLIQERLLPALSVGFAASVAEEFGWRGFMQEQLFRRGYSNAQTAALTAVSHMAFHALPNLLLTSDMLQGGGGKLSWQLVLPTTLLLVPHTVTHTFLFIQSRGSLLPGLLFHTVMVASAFCMHGPMSQEQGWEKNMFYALCSFILLQLLNYPLFWWMSRHSMRGSEVVQEREAEEQEHLQHSQEGWSRRQLQHAHAE